MDRLAPCRSISPSGEPCVRARGHQGKQGMWHENPVVPRRWRGGIKTPAYWRIDNGPLTEADYQSWMRL